jgi:hypothetical protein
MTQQVKKSSFNLNKNNKIVLAVAALLLCVLIAAGASTILTNPADENVTGTPTDKPAATPTPTPSSTVKPTAISLSSNITTPWYKTDFLELKAQLNQPVAGIPVTLYNKGNAVINGTTGQPVIAYTDSTGLAIFVRNPQAQFDYSISAPDTVPAS